MLDRYIRGSVTRQSPEANVPVVLSEGIENKIGGAGNVALNFKAFGCETHLIGVIGSDGEGQILNELLEKQGVTSHLMEDSKRPTTLKTRVLNQQEHLLRVDFESKSDISETLEKQILERVEILLEHYHIDLLVLQDYNKGLLTATLIDSLIQLGKAFGCHISVDPKKDHFWKYQEVNLFKPNLKESAEALGLSTRIEYDQLGKALITELKANKVAITLSEDGIIILNQKGEISHIPARSIDVIDVCGAGDAVLAILSLGDHLGLDDQTLGELSNQTGAQVCMSSGVVTVQPQQLPWSEQI